MQKLERQFNLIGNSFGILLLLFLAWQVWKLHYLNPKKLREEPARYTVATVTGIDYSSEGGPDAIYRYVVGAKKYRVDRSMYSSKDIIIGEKCFVKYLVSDPGISELQYTMLVPDLITVIPPDGWVRIPDTALAMFLYENCYKYDFDSQKKEYIRMDLEGSKIWKLFEILYGDDDDYDLRLTEVYANLQRFVKDAREVVNGDWKHYLAISDSIEMAYLCKRKDEWLADHIRRMLRSDQVEEQEKTTLREALMNMEQGKRKK